MIPSHVPAAFRVAASIALTLCVLHAEHAQPAPGSDTVPVSFLAIGRDGQPVLDLRSEEVALRVNGRPRTITSIERVDSPPAAPGARSSLPAPFGTNASSGGGGGRTFFFVIEDASFRPGNERLAKQAVDQFLNALSDGDRVALVTLPHPTVRTEPTTAAEVRAALARVAGVAPPNPTDDEVSARTRTTLEGLRGLLDSIGATGTPSTVIFLSGGMSANTRLLGKLGTSSGDLAPEHFQNVGAAAAAARAHVYVAQANLMVTQRSDGLDNLAGVVGAQVMVLTASGDNALNRVVTETSTSYIATFEPEASERNGQNHRLELRVTRPDVTTRAGTNLRIARQASKTARKAPNPRDMLREATVYRDLPLRVAGFVSRDAGDKIKLVIVGEPTDPATKITAAIVGVYGPNGRLTQATIPPEALSTLPLMTAVVLSPGTHRIRLAASDSTGRGGTADYQIAAELVSAGPLKLSTLLLGSNDSGGFKPLLQFKDEQTALATLELYGKPPTTLPLRLELAASPDGPPLQQAQASGSGTKDPDRFTLSGTFQIGSLAPGDYVVRAIVGSAESGGEGRVVRTLRKTR